MSFIPVSEAIQQLENDGLVESRPRVGTRVRVPTEQEVRERYVLREALESQSSRLCAEHATFQERLELRRAADQLDAMSLEGVDEKSDVDSLFGLHTQHFGFHMRIAEYARCEVLRHAIEKNQVLVFNWLYAVSANRRGLPPGFHRDLSEVITQATPAEADQAMRKHISYEREDVVSSIADRTSDGWRRKRSAASEVEVAGTTAPRSPSGGVEEETRT